ncbi:MAG: hypothetical protein E6R03_03920 [Hyphomicrobiaceae bacterium]|nr:MAG: hypothetical protein E6R03_03920 [Hyphomicrobiaceae bacterium]
MRTLPVEYHKITTLEVGEIAREFEGKVRQAFETNGKSSKVRWAEYTSNPKYKGLHKKRRKGVEVLPGTLYTKKLSNTAYFVTFRNRSAMTAGGPTGPAIIDEVAKLHEMGGTLLVGWNQPLEKPMAELVPPGSWKGVNWKEDGGPTAVAIPERSYFRSTKAAHYPDVKVKISMAFRIKSALIRRFPQLAGALK